MSSSRKTFQLMPDFDAAILKRLPNAGAKVGGFHHLGMQVKGLGRLLSEEAGVQIRGSQIAGRVQILQHHGFVTEVDVQPVSLGKGYQITPKGRQWLKDNGYDD